MLQRLNCRFLTATLWKSRHSRNAHRRVYCPKRTKRVFSVHANSVGEPEAPISAYLHLPFCKRRCFYCDFPIQVVGNKPDSGHVQDYMEEYVNVICKEMSATKPLGQGKLKTVFFGGGTPSLTPPHLLERILSAVDRHFGVHSDAEISMEVDPGTFDVAKLQAFKSLGVSRFSMGVQCFDEELLKACGRSHTLKDVYAAIQDIHAVQPGSWSLDLISGLPHLTEDLWGRTLNEAIDANPDHISVYDLQIESSTPFGRWYKPGRAPLPTDDQGAAMFSMASERLRSAGYEHYEVSNYAKSGHRCRHNMGYWMGLPFYAFGLGAASFYNGARFHRPKKMKEYVAWVDEYVAQGGVVDVDDPMQYGDAKECGIDAVLDLVMLRLRMKDGLGFKEVVNLGGEACKESICHAVESHVRHGLVEKFDEHGAFVGHEGWNGVHGIRLADPQGFLLSNDVISTIFARIS